MHVQFPCPTQLLKAGGSCSGAVVHLWKNLGMCPLERDQKTMLLAAETLQGFQPHTRIVEFPVWFYSHVRIHAGAKLFSWGLSCHSLHS